MTTVEHEASSESINQFESLVYINGTFYPESEAKISVFDHGLLYGDGVFEGIQAYNKRIFKLDEHVDRLYESAKAIRLEVPVSKEEMAQKIIETCRRNEITDGYIRPIITRGIGDLGLDPRKCSNSSVIIIAKSISLYGDKHEKGLEVITAATRRNPPEALSPNIKSLNYLNNILAKIESNLCDADEVLLLDINGYVSEASGDNVFIVKSGKITTPPTNTNLKGITRNVTIELAEKRGYVVEEKMLSLFDLYTADEFFLTGTAAEIAPVVELDDRKIATGKPGRITQELMVDYHELVRSNGAEIY